MVLLLVAILHTKVLTCCLANAYDLLVFTHLVALCLLEECNPWYKGLMLECLGFYLRILCNLHELYRKLFLV